MWSLPENSLLGGSPWCCCGAAAHEIGSAPRQTLKHQLQDLPSQWIPEPLVLIHSAAQSPNPAQWPGLHPLYPKNPLRTFPAVPLLVNSPRNSRIWVCSARSTVRTGTSELLRNSGFIFTLGLGSQSWAWRKGQLRKREKGRGQVKHHKHLQPPAFPGSINSAQERTIFILF